MEFMIQCGYAQKDDFNKSESYKNEIMYSQDQDDIVNKNNIMRQE